MSRLKAPCKLLFCSTIYIKSCKTCLRALFLSNKNAIIIIIIKRAFISDPLDDIQLNQKIKMTSNKNEINSIKLYYNTYSGFI